jgi:serine/threonine protein kinase
MSFTNRVGSVKKDQRESTQHKDSVSTKDAPPVQEPSEQKNTEKPDPDRKRRLLNYEVGTRLGKGSYAVVHLAVDVDTGKRYALKSYEKEKMSSNTRKGIIENEIKVLNCINHPRVVRLHKVIQTKNHVGPFLTSRYTF